MILSLLVLVPLLALSVWAFFRFTPPGIHRGLRRYNVSAVLAGVLFCGGYSILVYTQMIGSVDANWWPVLAVLGSLAIFPAWLLLAGLLRNLVLFRNPRTSSDHLDQP